MYFKRIEIHGFKSFAEPIVIEFARGITCVVGPNGSGKSNICDAIRWVLGAQSARSLRGEKMEDVIFSGTVSRKSRGMAEVTLVIANDDGALPIDYEEVAITRRMYRSGESEYLINNTRCRMKDIRNLIMDTGIGVEGYSIIGQGKISDIISNNTASIREILEETAGIVMYRSRKANAERKLAAATDNIQRVNDIIGEIEGRIDQLQVDSEKATEYLSLKDRHKELEINITLKNIEGIRLKSEAIKDDLEALEQRSQTLGAERDILQQQALQGRQAREALEKALEEGRIQERQLSDTINALQKKYELAGERRRAIGENQLRLQEEIQDFQGRAQREDSNLAALVGQRQAADQKADFLRRDLEEKTAEGLQLQEQAAALTAAVDDQKSRLFELVGEIGTHQAEISSIQALRQTMERRQQVMLQEEAHAGSNTQESQKKLALLGAEKQALEQAIDALKEQVAKARKDRVEDTKRSGTLTAQLESARIEAGQLVARQRALADMQTRYEGYSGAVRFIMKEGITGIHGVVADLIQVPAGYETAIETALGAALQNVVCADDGTAKEAVNRLKRDNAGRLTFLPLTAVRGRKQELEKVVEQAPGFLGRGVDKVQFDQAYQGIMEYLLGGIVLMDNMDNALALSKKMTRRLRMVTLEGEVINPAGAITGGRYKNKNSNILERRREVDLLKEKVEAKNKEVQALQKERETLESRLATFEEAIQKGEQELSALRTQSFAKENEIALLEHTVKEGRQAAERREKELADIRRETANSDELIAVGQEKIQALQEEKKALEQALEEAEKARIAQRDQVLDSGEKITDARIALNTQESAVAQLEAMTVRVQRSLEEYNGEVESRERKLKALAQELEELGSDEGTLPLPLQQAMAQREELAQSLVQKGQERDSLLQSLAAKEQAREEMEGTYRALQDQKYELQIRQARQDTQLENAKEKLWEEFEVSYIQAIEFQKEDFVVSAAIKENRDIKNRLKALGDVNVGAIREYASVKERYEFLTGQRGDILQSMEELKSIINDMDKITRSRFKSCFDQVVMNFEAVFQELYGGGHANITLSDKDDPFNAEIEITAQPPGKQLKHINLLSGGEKTMTAIALMFAVLKTKPTPCCILDEIEAALDDSNLGIFGNYVKNFDGVQFTLITHQKATMEHADVMYGITMPESGVSRVYSLRMEDVAPEEGPEVQ